MSVRTIIRGGALSVVAVCAAGASLVAAEEPVKLEKVDAAELKALAKNDSGRLRLVSVWATWCGPCVEEFPALVDIDRTYRARAFETVTVSADDLDQESNVLEFLKKQGASSMRNLLFRESDPYKMVDAIDPQWSGDLPHTVLLAPGGRILYRSEAAFNATKLRQAIDGWLGQSDHKPSGARD